MKSMGRWEPIPDLLQFYLPTALALGYVVIFMGIVWPLRKDYGRGLVWGHAVYILWFLSRMFSALFTADRRTTGFMWERIILAALMIGIVAISIRATHRRIERREEVHKDYYGPEALWSPEPIVGYRITVHSLGGEYYSGGPATCRGSGSLHAEPSPVWGCRCGYYAMKTLEGTLLHRNASLAFAVIVLLWGKVIECEEGYRAQYMRPIGYWGNKPRYVKQETIEVQTMSNIFPTTVTTNPDVNRSIRFYDLPVVRSQEQLDALVEKARKEFDPDAPPPYDGGHNGHW